MGELKKGACHCGAVRFEAEVDLTSARRCDCSICRMRGAVAVSAPLDRFTLLAGEDALRLCDGKIALAAKGPNVEIIELA